jgi:adenylate cyclase
LDRAIALDNEFAAAYAWKACILGQAIGRGFLPEPENLIQKARESVEIALRLDENEVEAHRVLAEMRIDTKQIRLAVYHNDRALELNSNDPRLSAQKGEILTWQGNFDEGVKRIRLAIRLDPYSAPMWAHLLGRALMMSGAFSGAIDAYLKSGYPRYGYYAEMAACYKELGQDEEALRQCELALQLNPGFSLDGYCSSLPFKQTEDQARHHKLLAAAFK